MGGARFRLLGELGRVYTKLNTAPIYFVPAVYFPLCRQGAVLNAHNLRYNFLLHLLNLWDNSLLAAHHISHCEPLSPDDQFVFLQCNLSKA